MYFLRAVSLIVKSSSQSKQFLTEMRNEKSCTDKLGRFSLLLEFNGLQIYVLQLKAGKMYLKDDFLTRSLGSLVSNAINTTFLNGCDKRLH